MLDRAPISGQLLQIILNDPNSILAKDFNAFRLMLVEEKKQETKEFIHIMMENIRAREAFEAELISAEAYEAKKEKTRNELLAIYYENQIKFGLPKPQIQSEKEKQYLFELAQLNFLINQLEQSEKKVKAAEKAIEAVEDDWTQQKSKHVRHVIERMANETITLGGREFSLQLNEEEERDYLERNERSATKPLEVLFRNIPIPGALNFNDAVKQLIQKKREQPGYSEDQLPQTILESEMEISKVNKVPEKICMMQQIIDTVTYRNKIRRLLDSLNEIDPAAIPSAPFRIINQAEKLSARTGLKSNDVLDTLSNYFKARAELDCAILDEMKDINNIKTLFSQITDHRFDVFKERFTNYSPDQIKKLINTYLTEDENVRARSTFKNS